MRRITISLGVLKMNWLVYIDLLPPSSVFHSLKCLKFFPFVLYKYIYIIMLFILRYINIYIYYLFHELIKQIKADFFFNILNK